MAVEVSIQKTGHIPWKKLLINMCTFKRLSTIFLVCYLFIVIVIFSTFMTSKQQDGIMEQLSWENENSQVKRELNFVPKMPLRNQTYSDGCHDNLGSVLQPDFKGLSNEDFVLSAYFDPRHSQRIQIHILALRKIDEEPRRPIYCLVNDAVSRKLQAVEAMSYALQDNGSFEYGGYILSCDVTGLVQQNPCKVRISLNTTMDEKVLMLPTLDLHSGKWMKRKGIAICVPPLSGAITQNQVVEFVELYKILGAEKIYFYKYIDSENDKCENPNLKQVLDYYRGSNRVRIHPWKLSSDLELWSQGQALALQHCLYSNMAFHEYVLAVNLDEFLIPRNTYTLPALTESLEGPPNTNSRSSYCFQVANFIPNVLDTVQSISAVQREKNNAENQVRCLVKPERTLELRLDKIPKSTEDFNPYGVKPTDASVHSYRGCSLNADSENICTSTIKDKTALKYKYNLTENFSNVMKLLT